MAIIESEIRLLTEDEICKFWTRYLWKDRKDPIRPMSSMTLGGGFDMTIYLFYRARYLGLFVNNELVGCNSCHPTSGTEMRSRGLYLHEEYRGKGLSKVLFKATEDCAAEQGRSILWSYPRESALYAYLKFGFTVHPAKAESSSHCYVSKKVDRSQ